MNSRPNCNQIRAHKTHLKLGIARNSNVQKWQVDYDDTYLQSVLFLPVTKSCSPHNLSLLLQVLVIEVWALWFFLSFFGSHSCHVFNSQPNSIQWEPKFSFFSGFLDLADGWEPAKEGVEFLAHKDSTQFWKERNSYLKEGCRWRPTTSWHLAQTRD